MNSIISNAECDSHTPGSFRLKPLASIIAAGGLAAIIMSPFLKAADIENVAAPATPLTQLKTEQKLIKPSASTGSRVVAPELQLAEDARRLMPYEAIYQAEIKGMKVRMQRNLLVDDDRVTVSMSAKKLIFAISETSESSITETGDLRSVSYTHKRRNLGDRKDRHAEFDWQANTVVDLLNEGQKAIAIEFPLYDKISYQEQFRLDLSANPAQERFEYRITDGRGIKDYVFINVGEETITTPLGELNCLKFKRDRGENSERETYIWFAKDWDFLLARLDQIEGKDAKPERLELRQASIAGQSVVPDSE